MYVAVTALKAKGFLSAIRFGYWLFLHLNKPSFLMAFFSVRLNLLMGFITH